MQIKKLVPFVTLAVFFALSGSAQVKTNTPELQRAAQLAAIRQQDLSNRLTMLSRQKGWPLLIHYKKGGRAVLSGIDPNGMPLYVAAYDNLISAQTIGTDQLWPGGSTGLNLNGSLASMKGKIAIWDEGIVLPTHVELTGRVLQKDKPSSTSLHSTHVAGTMIASGVNPAAKGMSFGAQQLLAFDFNGDVSEMFGQASTLLISNHSYGTVAGWNQNTDENNRWEFLGNPGDTADYKFGYYDDQSRDWDSIAFQAPDYLIVKAASNNRDVNGPAVGQPYFRPDKNGNIVAAGNRPAGISNNDGFDIIPTYGVAKNILTIGAVNPIPGGYTQPSDVVLSEFSSWGPTDDGRIKPELVSDGVNVLSCSNSSDNSYAILSGTSMASPAAAGSAFLLQQLFANLHSGSFMRSATLKGILIHTADEAGPAAGPDFQMGYGLINMKNAAAVISSGNTDQQIYENNLATGNSFTLPLVASGKGPLVVTLSWTDPPGTVNETALLNNPARKLVNDLDLRVTGNAATYAPWILDAKHPANMATTGDDTLNNVEKIVINNVVPGKTYTITVTHKGTLRNAQQAYSLIVSGAGGTGYCASNPLSSAGTRINTVNISNINNTNPAGCTTYTDYSSKTIQLQGNQTTPFSIGLGSCDASASQKVVKIFVDYNNNGTFTDPGEQVATSAVLAGGTVTFNGNFKTPAGLKVGTYSLMRIVAEETTDTSAVQPCGTYGNGETEDFRVQFVSLSNDVGVGAVVDPLATLCATDSQRISVRINNFGTTPQVNVPLSCTVQSGGTDIAAFSINCPDTIPALGNVIYTFQPPFAVTAGQTYIIKVGTGLSTDQDSSNNTTSDTVSVNSGSSNVTGVAEICNSSSATASLAAVGSDSTDVVKWYDAQNAVTPIATGSPATTTDIPADKTYYLGLNENSGSVGPANKLQFANGGYNVFQGNYIRFTNAVPLTISTTRLYVGHGGKVQFIVADLASIDSSTGAYSYFPISTNTINVYPTTPTPQAGAVTGNNASDTGAIFFLNLSVPTAGNHILIVIADSVDQPTLFRNNQITSNPYPFTLPGIFSITGNSVIDNANTKDTVLYQQYYYFLYDVHVRLNKCASPRVAVTATMPAAPVITLNGQLLTSSFASNNQWYRNDSLIAGATSQTYTITIPGIYTDVAVDSAGCSQVSNAITYGTTSGLNLKVGPIPTTGTFNMTFYLDQSQNVDISIVNSLGQRILTGSYPNFGGFFSHTFNLSNQGAGVYILKLMIGNDKHIIKVIVE